MAVLSRVELERIIRKAGADRVGLDAPDVMAEILEDRAMEILERAVRIARHAQRPVYKRRAKGKRKVGSVAGIASASARVDPGSMDTPAISPVRRARRSRRVPLTLTKRDILLALTYARGS